MKEHECIQENRIARLDDKLDTIGDHFQPDGIVWKMSGQIERIAASKDGNGAIKQRTLIAVITVLAGIVATLVGFVLPGIG